MIAYSLIFLALIIAVLVFLEDSDGEKSLVEQIIYYGIVAIMLVLAAFRPYGIDNDSPNYVAMFYGTSGEEIDVEVSFAMIVSFVKIFTDDPRLLFVVYALLAVPLRAYSLARLSKYWMMSLLLWLAYYYIMQDFTQIRGAVATGVFIFSLFYLQQGKRLLFVILVMLALFFHTISLIYLPLIFLSTKPLSNVKVTLLAVLPVIAVLINLLHIDPVMYLPIPYLQERIELYEALRDTGIMGDEINVFNVVFLAKLLIFYFILWKHRVITEAMPALPLLLQIFVFSVCSFLVFSFLPVLAWRLTEALGVVEMVLFPCVAYAFEERYYGKMLFVAYAMALMMQTIFLNDAIRLEM